MIETIELDDGVCPYGVYVDSGVPCKAYKPVLDAVGMKLQRKLRIAVRRGRINERSR